ncbi:acetylxylan esterase [Occultella glacieicola]
MLVDMPLDRLRDYRPDRTEPGDFDSFWDATLTQARDAATEPAFVRLDSDLVTVDVFDVTFSGYAGQPVKGWLLIPRHTDGPLPCVIDHIGYNGGRSLPHDWLAWSAAGYANLVMDVRGQGSKSGLVGATADPDPVGSPQVGGFLTRGINDPATYYYRRLYTDAVRAVDVMRAHPRVDPHRVFVAGGSQGGGVALAVAGLQPGLAGVMINVPFLCHIRRATEITDASPYSEITSYLQTHRTDVEQVFHTLSYFDGVNLAARANSPALFSVGLMDATCPPSTVFAAYNHYGAQDKEMVVWAYSGHEGGQAHQRAEMYRFARHH